MSIDEIIKLLVEVRVDLTVLKKSVTSKEIKEQLKWAINGIDIIGCEQTQYFRFDKPIDFFKIKIVENH